MTIYYVSSKLKHKDMWLKSGLDIISSWIRNEDKVEGSYALTAMWNEYRNEMHWADAFALFLDQPTEKPKGALIELGMAFDKNIPIYIVWAWPISVLQDILGTIIHHENVNIVRNIQELPR